MKILLIYFVSCMLLYSDTLEYVKESKNSVFTINLETKNKKNIIGNFCYVSRNGAKIDCDNSFEGRLKNKNIYFYFNSSFGGKNGKAMISFISEKKIEWTLLKPPKGEFYTPKKAILVLDEKVELLSKNSTQVKLNKKTQKEYQDNMILLKKIVPLNGFEKFRKTIERICARYDEIKNQDPHILFGSLYDMETNLCINNFVELKLYKKNISINFFLNQITKKIQNKNFSISDLLFIKNLDIEIPLSPKTLTQYNDIAYYLQKAGANEEAVYLLEKIIKKFPKRTVAYINLGDAYWALGEKTKARKAYTTYIEQMCDKGLQKKIPKEVLKRVERKYVCK